MGIIVEEGSHEESESELANYDGDDLAKQLNSMGISKNKKPGKKTRDMELEQQKPIKQTKKINKRENKKKRS